MKLQLLSVYSPFIRPVVPFTSRCAPNDSMDQEQHQKQHQEQHQQQVQEQEQEQQCVQIRWRYLEMCSLSVLEELIKGLPGWPSYGAQNGLVAAVFQWCELREQTDATFRRPPLQYTRSFVKKLNKMIEQDNAEMSDSLGEIIVSLYQGGVVEEDENIAYLSYHVPSGDNARVGEAATVSIRTERSFNEVGMTVWGAGIFLAELCLYSNILSGLVL
jgi:hypothetical protein